MAEIRPTEGQKGYAVETRVAEVDRHDAILRSLTAAQVRGDLTEEQALSRKNAAYEAHIDLRLAIQREGRERELAWEAGYRERLLSLQMEGEADEARLARLGTEQRVAALQEETRLLVEELRRRGEHARAQEVENAAAAARARIEREGRLREAMAGGDFAEGFQARISKLREETAAWGRLGAEMADLATQGLSQGVTRALEEVARGTKSAKEAFRDWAREFAFDIARMIQQELILKAILALFPGLSEGAGHCRPAVVRLHPELGLASRSGPDKSGYRRATLQAMGHPEALLPRRWCREHWPSRNHRTRASG